MQKVLKNSNVNHNNNSGMDNVNNSSSRVNNMNSSININGDRLK